MLKQVEAGSGQRLEGDETGRGADLLVRSLKAAGVTRIYSLSGNQIMPVYDACIDAGIEIVHTRHEAAAVFMADAHAQITGGLGVALVTAAPGAMNALGALYSARTSESPVLILTGDSSVSQDGMGAFQELDQVSIVRPLVKSSQRPETVEALGSALTDAIRTARSGRPGPVHIALPFDVLETETTFVPIDPSRFDISDQAGTEEDCAALLDAVDRAERPLVLMGPSLSATRQGDLAERFSNALDCPVVVMESPRGLKDPSLGAFASVLSKADLIVTFGKPIDFTLGFGKPAAPDCRWIVLDPDSAEIERARRNLGTGLIHAIQAEARPFAESVIGCARRETRAARSDWRETATRLIAARSEADRTESEGRVTPQALTRAVQSRLDKAGESIVVCDGGEFGQWAQAGTNGTRRIVNGPSGAIGGSPCYGLAAKLARPQALVYALMGDGTVGFHLAEFETAAREGAAFVAIVGNDMCWNAEHQIQLRQYGPDRLIGCQLSDARYDLAVAALGGHGEFVSDIADLDAALARAEASGKVALVNVLIEGRPAPSGTGH
ncbi:acetolactate synthase-1/2/3 large subunit [Fulvimarina manganoxydans]|uniref:Acetolactate synthase-1/2/3 large subunit n=1 Tax=Fulvimarina manganoxydans TaxID=937218 RepID=A0A1W1ZEE9_9HYPH|nr:thiamine pyrophosphate-binding protein [Fulvimarina manganoxydans]SMC46572.1 acetolactate synthase-1/2/3 large subunit [Fulvimarina manganoxydans]